MKNLFFRINNKRANCLLKCRDKKHVLSFQSSTQARDVKFHPRHSSLINSVDFFNFQKTKKQKIITDTFPRSHSDSNPFPCWRRHHCTLLLCTEVKFAYKLVFSGVTRLKKLFSHAYSTGLLLSKINHSSGYQPTDIQRRVCTPYSKFLREKFFSPQI